MRIYDIWAYIVLNSLLVYLGMGKEGVRKAQLSVLNLCIVVPVKTNQNFKYENKI